jgi:hypothetical protein
MLTSIDVTINYIKNKTILWEFNLGQDNKDVERLI